jgi:multiple sugar transport system substrate-binding protein
MSKPEENEKVTRRNYLKIAGGTIAGLVVGGALGYVAKPTLTAPPTTETQTVTQTVSAVQTVTGSAALPATSGPASDDWWMPDKNPLYLKITEPVTLKMFLSTDFPPKVIRDAFTAVYPKITFQVTATADYASLVTAMAQGTYIYDGFRAQFLDLEQLKATKNLLDIGSLLDLSTNLPGEWSDWVLSAVAGIDGTPGKNFYAVPEDLGPTVMYYRKDIFDQYGVTSAPTTWDEFAAAASKVYEGSGKKVYIANFSPNDLANFADATIWNMGGLTVQPVLGQADTYKVYFNSPQTVKILEYWGDLITKGSVSCVTAFTEQWDRLLSGDAIASVPIGAAWFGPNLLAHTNPQQSGKWRLAPIPQWNQGDNVHGLHGGSVIGVTQVSPHPEAAALFALWCCVNPVGVRMGWEQAAYSADLRLLKTLPFWNDTYRDYFGGQNIQDYLVPGIPPVDPKHHFTRFELGIEAVMGEEFGAAASGTKTWAKACDDAQARATSLIQQAGGTVVPA